MKAAQILGVPFNFLITFYEVCTKVYRLKFNKDDQLVGVVHPAAIEPHPHIEPYPPH